MKKYGYIAVFGAAGALLRYLISLLMRTGTFPLATLVANLVGCLGLGLLVGFIEVMEIRHPNLVIGLKAGLLGSFTTFSSFCLDSVKLASSGMQGLALAYSFSSLAFGMILAGIGMTVGEVLGLRSKGIKESSRCKGSKTPPPEKGGRP